MGELRCPLLTNGAQSCQMFWRRGLVWCLLCRLGCPIDGAEMLVSNPDSGFQNQNLLDIRSPKRALSQYERSRLASKKGWPVTQPPVS